MGGGAGQQVKMGIQDVLNPRLSFLETDSLELSQNSIATGNYSAKTRAAGHAQYPS